MKKSFVKEYVATLQEIGMFLLVLPIRIVILTFLLPLGIFMFGAYLIGGFGVIGAWDELWHREDYNFLLA